MTRSFTHSNLYHWKPRVVMMPTLLSLMAGVFCRNIPRCHEWRQSWHYTISRFRCLRLITVQVYIRDLFKYVIYHPTNCMHMVIYTTFHVHTGMRDSAIIPRTENLSYKCNTNRILTESNLLSCNWKSSLTKSNIKKDLKWPSESLIFSNLW